jgi:hypothetical protein
MQWIEYKVNDRLENMFTPLEHTFKHMFLLTTTKDCFM